MKVSFAQLSVHIILKFFKKDTKTVDKAGAMMYYKSVLNDTRKTRSKTWIKIYYFTK